MVNAMYGYEIQNLLKVTLQERLRIKILVYRTNQHLFLKRKKDYIKLSIPNPIYRFINFPQNA